MKIKVGISGDLLNSNGIPCFGNEALSKIKTRSDIEITWMDKSVKEVTEEMASKFDAILLNIPKASAKSVSRDDCKLKIISRFGVGYDSVDIEAMKEKGIVVTNTPNAVRRPVAVAALTMMFALSGKLLKKNDLVRAGQWNDRTNFMGMGLTQKTLGIVDNNCHIWDGDCYQKYCKAHPSVYHDDMFSQEEFIEHIKEDESFAKNWGNLGPIYGKQWRDWNGFEIVSGAQVEDYNKGVDQIQNLINELKTNPDSRRLMVNAWNVGELDKMTLPPCHYGFQVYTRLTTREEKIINPGKYRAISLMWNQRSVDTFLGLPFNIASYGLLLEMIAKEVNMIPDELIGNLGDVHLYSNHIEQAKEQMTREPMKLPIVKLSSGHNLRAALKGNFEEIEISDIILMNYQSYPTIKAPLSN